MRSLLLAFSVAVLFISWHAAANELADADVDVAEAHAVNARHLLQGVRSFSKVSSHKNPQQPKMTRKTWERKQPLRMLLDTDVDVAEAHAVNARHLLQGVRSFSKVSSHKNPQQPKMTRKTWERKQPLRMLLDTDVDVAEAHAVNARHLLQGVRSFSKVSSHKNPQQPKMTRKTWERKMP